MRALILRFDSPMMSFGSAVVDHHGFTDVFPAVSMLTGMIGNALGWHHDSFDLLQSLQTRIDFAARWDVRPRKAVDYHTVDLNSPKMTAPGWTTRGEAEHRGWWGGRKTWNTPKVSSLSRGRSDDGGAGASRRRLS